MRAPGRVNLLGGHVDNARRHRHQYRHQPGNLAGGGVWHAGTCADSTPPDLNGHPTMFSLRRVSASENRHRRRSAAELGAVPGRRRVGFAAARTRVSRYQRGVSGECAYARRAEFVSGGRRDVRHRVAGARQLAAGRRRAGGAGYGSRARVSSAWGAAFRTSLPACTRGKVTSCGWTAARWIIAIRRCHQSAKIVICDTTPGANWPVRAIRARPGWARRRAYDPAAQSDQVETLRDVSPEQLTEFEVPA